MEKHMVQLTIQLGDEIAARLEATAAASGLDEASVIEAALLLYSEQAAAFRAFVAEGEADLAAGRVVPMEEAFAEAQAIIEKARHGAA